ncbi:hypothetical protein GW17_00054061 [Ensete ventricosum]|nr:hypothetical protein GW17_00054061 [Ensete ventricosum]
MKWDQLVADLGLGSVTVDANGKKGQPWWHDQEQCRRGLVVVTAGRGWEAAMLTAVARRRLCSYDRTRHWPIARLGQALATPARGDEGWSTSCHLPSSMANSSTISASNGILTIDPTSQVIAAISLLSFPVPPAWHGSLLLTAEESRSLPTQEELLLSAVVPRW